MPATPHVVKPIAPMPLEAACAFLDTALPPLLTPCHIVPAPAPCREDEGAGSREESPHDAEEEEDFVRGRRGSVVRRWAVHGSHFPPLLPLLLLQPLL